MRIARLATLVFALLALLGSSVAASGFENTGLGTTARGMGGAFRAVANDWTAAYYNPAGYAFIVDNQVGGALSLFHLRNEITPDYAATDNFGNEYGWGIVNGQTVYNFHRILNNPSGGLILRTPLWGETVFGLSIYEPFDQSIDWRLYALDGSFMRAYNPTVIGTLEMPSDHYKNDLDVVAFQLTVAREYSDSKLAVGLGLQLLRGDLRYMDLVFRDNPMEGNVSIRPRDMVPEFTDNMGSGWGFGVRAGVLWKAHEMFDVGVSAYVPSNITIKGDTKFDFIMPYIEPNQRESQATDPDSLFSNGEIKTFDSQFETELKLPASFGLGVAFHPNERLTVAVDAEYTLWSVYDGLAFTYTDFIGVGDVVPDWFKQDLTRPVEWDDAGKVALGLTYDLYPQLTLIAGGSADQSPCRNSTEFTPQFMDLGTKYGISGGATFHSNRWDLGVITSYTDYPDINLKGLTDINNDDIYDNFPGDYKAATYETVLSLAYRF